MTKRIKSLARQVALRSESRFRVGAVIYNGSSVYGIGANDMCKTHPKSPHPHKAVHAEFMALQDALNERKTIHGTKVFVYRIKKDGSEGLAKPCEHCHAMLLWYGIKKIEYTTGD